MDPRGLRTRLTGAGCTSCGAAIPADRIAVLADRGDLAFLELTCPRCGSETLSVLLGPGSGSAAPILDTAAHPELDPDAEARLAGRPPLGDADVASMHRFLATWDGDLRTLLEGPDESPQAGAGG